jgi:hypothetical protein
MVTYQDYAKDLRTLADLLDAHAYDLPLPRYAGQGLGVDIHVAEATDVMQAATALDTQVSRIHGHTNTSTSLDTVHLRFVHVTDDVMAEHRARMAYAKTMSTDDAVAQVTA